jgi:large repetitive protein
VAGEPIETFEINGQRYVINGHHRVAAAKKAGIDVNYRDLSLDELRAEYDFDGPEEVIAAWSEVAPDRLGGNWRRR